MFLKSYSGLSDFKLIEQLNGNIHYQLFCGVHINPASPLTNYKIVSEIRCEIASLLDIDLLQGTLSSYWKPYMDNQQIDMTDATCYESYIRYPSNIKLLWESVEWLYSKMCHAYKKLGQRKPRTKYDKQAFRYATIKEIYSQQRLLNGQPVKDRIVSIDKPYIHPIVRGKETKSVEFGAKVNMIQIDGINFIEHLSFSAFHEGIRLPQCVDKHQHLMHRKVSHIAADRLYATNDNRTFCRKHNIITGFVRKGRAGKDEEQMKIIRSILSKERATRLEGSFGTEKQHYNLQKVKARREETEILWIFFGIHTANAVRMVGKMKKKKQYNTA